VTRSVPTLMAMLSLVGCLREPPGDGGQFGEESGSGCKATARAPLADDEVSPLGFAPEVLVELAVPSSGILRWVDGAETALELAPERDGPAEYVEYAWVDDGPSGGMEPMLDPWCPNRVELPYRVGFTTDDGAFAETFALRLGADTSEAVQGSIAPRAYDGAFDPWTFAPDGNDFDEVRASLELWWTAEGASGTVSGQGEGVDGALAYAQAFDIAVWGPRVEP
jgi:hypothetical protein